MYNKTGFILFSQESSVEVPGHLQTYIPLIQAVGKTLGVGEVILYDLTQDIPTIIAKEGGITGRLPGTPRDTASAGHDS